MESKQRHGCVTAWLILMIIANSLTAVIYLFMGDLIAEAIAQSLPQPIMTVLAIIGIANLIFAIMLLKWKRWAFWAYVATSIITLIINLSIDQGVLASFLGLSGAIILYAILQIKKDGISAWKSLE